MSHGLLYHSPRIPSLCLLLYYSSPLWRISAFPDCTNIPVDGVTGLMGGGDVVRYGGTEVQMASADSSRVQTINPLGLSACDSLNISPFLPMNVGFKPLTNIRTNNCKH